MLTREVDLVHQGQPEEVRAREPGIGLSRRNTQPGAGVVGDEEQELPGQEHRPHAT